VAKGQALLVNDLPPEVTAAVRQAVAQTPAAASPGPSLPTTPAAAAVLPIRTEPASIAELAQILFRNARSDTKLRVLPAVERELIIQALKETSGNQVQAARLLGITRATLRKRVEKFAIRRELNVA
jgi:DNA-binding NtrC family response regulator